MRPPYLYFGSILAFMAIAWLWFYSIEGVLAGFAALCFLSLLMALIKALRDYNERGVSNPLYNTARWRRLRRQQLASSPLCVYSLEDEIVTEATVCDHVDPHKGDPEKFWLGPFQSLCKRCHDSRKQREELGQAQRGADASGWPLARNGE